MMTSRALSLAFCFIINTEHRSISSSCLLESELGFKAILVATYSRSAGSESSVQFSKKRSIVLRESAFVKSVSSPRA